MSKKTTKSKKISKKTNNFDETIDNFILKIGDIKPVYITIIGGLIFLLGIILQYSLIVNFVGSEASSLLFVNLENALLFALLFLGIFFIGTLFPPFFIFALIGALITRDPEYQKYIMFGGVVLGIIGFFFEWYRNFFKKHFNTITIIYIALFLISSFVYYRIGVMNKTTLVEITTSAEIFQGKLHFSNGDYYFVEKDGEKVILNSRDVKSLKIMEVDKDKKVENK